MNDVDYRAKELKSISVQAHRMNRRGKGAVRLPHDNLTKKELNKLNGKSKTYRMGNPMTKKEFLALPTDLKKLYICTLQDLYGMTNNMFAQMIGCTNVTAGRYITELGLKPVNSKSLTEHEREIRDAKWKAFCNGVVGGGDTPNSIIDPKNDAVEAVNDAVEPEVCEQEVLVEPVCAKTADPVALFQRLSFSTETDRDGLIDSGKSYQFNFEAVAL